MDAYQPVGKIEWSIYTFVAKGSSKVSEQSLDGGEKIDLQFDTFDEFVDMILAGKLGGYEMKIRFLEAKLDPNKMTELKRLIME